MKTISKWAIAILLIDFICFIAWASSGQIPSDGFYFGMITRNLLQAILF